MDAGTGTWTGCSVGEYVSLMATCTSASCTEGWQDSAVMGNGCHHLRAFQHRLGGGVDGGAGSPGGGAVDIVLTRRLPGPGPAGVTDSHMCILP